MNSKPYEDEFIEERKAQSPDMTPETEMVARYAFMVGFAEGYAFGRIHGDTDRTTAIHLALGLTAQVNR